MIHMTTLFDGIPSGVISCSSVLLKEKDISTHEIQ